MTFQFRKGMCASWRARFGDDWPVRPLLFCLVLVCACSRDTPATFRGRTAEHWSAALADETNREQAIAQLRQGKQDAVPLLADLLQSETRVARLIAAELIAGVGNDADRAVPALGNALLSGDAALRGSAAYALGRIGGAARPALDDLRRTFDDSDDRVRMAAASACWRITGEAGEALPVLIQGLESGNPGIRSMAVQSLAEIGSPAVDGLMNALGHSDPRARASAAEALGAIGPTAIRARRALYDALKDPNTTVRSAAEQALEKIRAR
jgi:HEAT repeat protein